MENIKTVRDWLIANNVLKAAKSKSCVVAISTTKKDAEAIVQNNSGGGYLFLKAIVDFDMEINQDTRVFVTRKKSWDRMTKKNIWAVRNEDVE